MRTVKISNCAQCPYSFIRFNEDESIKQPSLCMMNNMRMRIQSQPFYGVHSNCPLKKEPIKIELEAGEK